MREHRLVGLRVPDRAAGQIRAIGRIKYRGHLPFAVGAPADVGEIRDQLVKARENKINELDFEHRPASVQCQTATDADDRGLRERGVEHLRRKIRRKFLCEPEHPALRILDVFAENHPAGIGIQTGAQGAVENVAHAVLAGLEQLAA